MSLNIDSMIFIGFLVANFVLGLTSSKGIKTIKEYAVGNRNFSTATIVATIVATWISGTYFFTMASEAYNSGLYFIWGATLSDLICFLLIAVVFAPRMGEFLGKLSIAEAMGSLYGEKVRIITAISAFIGITGIISIELRAAGIAFGYALGIPETYGSVIAGLLITIYSSLGGIKSVTFTDVIQVITFGIVIPVILYFLLNSLSSIEVLTNVITTNPSFDYKQVFDFSQQKPIFFLFLFFFSAIPGFNAGTFQRITMASSTAQVSKSFGIAAFTCFILGLAIAWIGILTIALHPNINQNDVIQTIITDYSHIMGMKALILSGVMAMIMSTVDSFINAASVIVVHDFLKPLKVKVFKDELFSARVISLVIGLVAIALLFRQDSLLNLLVSAYSFYMPIVTLPFIMAILGFRSTEKSVILGMATGALTVILWNYFDIQVVDNIVPAMLANLSVLMGSHYLLKQDGGWVGIKDPAPLLAIRAERKLKFERFIKAVKEFNFLDACMTNCPKHDGLISLLGVFVMIVSFTSVSTLPKPLYDQYAWIIDKLYPLTLISSSALMGYPLWLQSWKETRAIGVIWNIIAFYTLICFSFLMVFISKFGGMQIAAFSANIIVISALVRWQWALSLIVLGVSVVMASYDNFIIMVGDSYGNLLDSNFKIVYFLLLISSSLIIFFKPKQEYQELAEERIEHLGMRIYDREEELAKSLALKNEFLRNLQHEVHTPITGITSMAQALCDSHKKMPAKKLQECLEIIAKSSERFDTYSNNILDLSKLSALTYDLHKIDMNLSELVRDRLEHCKKLYLGNKILEFVAQIMPNIELHCDKRYITSTIDNLIINAIQYSKEGKVTVTLHKTEAHVEFSVQDEGMGIPEKELWDIFGAFVVSSKTRTPAGGRGVGLALCKKAVEVHNGTIWAESDGIKGSKFKFTLPQQYSL